MSYTRREITKDHNFSSPGGGSGTFYAAGFYEAPAADANLTQASTSVNYGDTNVSYSAHAFVVCGGFGSVDTGQVGLRVNGTSIDELGNRTASDTETIISDITAVGANNYFETSKRFIGQVTYELFVVSGSPTTYNLDFNYGLAKYDDFRDRKSTLVAFEVVGRAGGNDSSFDIELLHHKSAGWTYHATAFAPGTTPLLKLSTDHGAEDEITNGEHFAWKRDNLSTDIDGSGSEGLIVRVKTGTNNAVEHMTIHTTMLIP